MSEPLALAVAKNLFKLMAYKDEYEVARLYADGSFAASLAKQFKGDFTLTFHLAPPILGRTDRVHRQAAEDRVRPLDDDGLPAAREAEAPARHGLRCLRPHGGAPHGAPAHRGLPRADREACSPSPNARASPTALEIAALPDMIRGFGHVKEANVAKAKAREAELLARAARAGRRRDARPRRSELVRALARCAPITLAAMRAAVKAAVFIRSRSGTNSTMQKPAIRALAATPEIRSVTCVIAQAAGRGIGDRRHLARIQRIAVERDHAVAILRNVLQHLVHALVVDVARGDDMRAPAQRVAHLRPRARCRGPARPPARSATHGHARRRAAWWRRSPCFRHSARCASRCGRRSAG